MIKVFTLNKNQKIELTKKELEELLNESFWDGYNQKNTYVYTTPIIPAPITYSTDSTTSCVSVSDSKDTTTVLK